MTGLAALPADPVVLGTMTFGDGVSSTDAARIVEDYRARGYRHIDTANGYAGGESERILGAVLGTDRDAVFLASKVGMAPIDAAGAAPLSKAGIERSLAGSLSRLGTDRLDLYYLHQPDRSTPVGETLDVLASLLEDGRIGAWGVSNFASWQLAEVVFEARLRRMPAPVVSQQMYNALCRKVETEFVEASARLGAPVIAYNPLAGGLLTGRHRYEDRPDEGRFGGERLGEMYTKRYWEPRIFEAIDRLRAIAEEAAMPLRELSLRWLNGRPGVAAVLIGGSKPEHIASNIDAVEAGSLEDALRERVDAVGDWLAGPVPDYNR